MRCRWREARFPSLFCDPCLFFSFFGAAMIDSAAMLGRKSFRLVNRSTVALEPGDNLHPARAGVAVVMMGFLPFAHEAVFVAGQQLRLCRIFQSRLCGPFKRGKLAQVLRPPLALRWAL